jgi:hypothetical protein
VNALRIAFFPILALLLPAAAPTPAPSPAPTRTVVFESGNAARAIPIDVAGDGLAFVKGQVGGNEVWLLLDTGSTSILSERLAEKLSLPGEGGLAGGGSGESRLPQRMLRDATIRLPGVEITQSGISSLDLDLLQTALGHRIDGILGTPFFESLVVEIDFARATVALRDPKRYRYAGRGRAIPLARDGGLPYVHARVTLSGKSPLEGEFLVDTGSDSASILYAPFVDAHQLLAPDAKAAPEAGAGAGGANLQAAVRAERIELGPFLFRSPVVQLSRSSKGLLADARHAGLLGGGILSRFRVIFDYARGRLILEENARYAEPFGYDASGLALTAGPDLSIFEIRRVAPGSPGATAGLIVGDFLLEVDGKPAKQIGLRGIRKLLQREEKRYVLTLFRNGAIRRVTITCRKLL